MCINEVEVIFFDTETNGLKSENSVLSISAIKTLVNYKEKSVKILDKYERFYYPIEDYNPSAISVNKLDRENISRRRGNRMYPKHFIDDQLSFFYFCGDIQHFVAHNIEFDSKFLKKKLPKQFCTMKSNTDIIKLPSQHKGVLYKWPKLEEATHFYKILSNNNNFHDSMYDVEMTIEVFKAMLNCDKGNKLIKKFLFDIDYSYKLF